MTELFLDRTPDRWRVQFRDYREHRVGTKRPATKSRYYTTRAAAEAAKARLRAQSPDLICGVRPVYARAN